MGSVRYLPAGVPATLNDWSNDQLAVAAIEHPLQPIVAGPEQPSDRYELFWSLCFAIPAKLFAAGGGFDETYRGYGGEDTDFAFRMRVAGVRFWFFRRDRLSPASRGLQTTAAAFRRDFAQRPHV